MNVGAFFYYNNGIFVLNGYLVYGLVRHPCSNIHPRVTFIHIGSVIYGICSIFKQSLLSYISLRADSYNRSLVNENMPIQSV